MHLMATSLPVSVSLALKTKPKEPWLRGDTVKNLLSRSLFDSKPSLKQAICNDRQQRVVVWIEDANATSRCPGAQRQNYAEVVQVASACKHVSRRYQKQVRKLLVIYAGTTVGRSQPGQLQVLGRRRIVSGVNRETKSGRDACRGTCRGSVDGVGTPPQIKGNNMQGTR